MENLIIETPWGGLGDNLLWSTIPEMCYVNDKECYISYKNSVRNKEIHDLVWGCNPHVKGFSFKPANAGNCKWKDILENISPVEEMYNISENIPTDLQYPFKDDGDSQISICFNKVLTC